MCLINSLFTEPEGGAMSILGGVSIPEILDLGNEKEKVQNHFPKKCLFLKGSIFSQFDLTFSASLT